MKKINHTIRILTESGENPIGFSLIELLVVIGIMAILLSLLMPSLSRARDQARSIVCRSNTRQIYLANTGYASENEGSYVRAAYDIWEGFGGRHRWHGVRISPGVTPDPNNNTFDPLKGPLCGYLADGAVKQCPQWVDFVTDGALSAFEAGCGGYGYNSEGIGSRCWSMGFCDQAMRQSTKISEVKNPSHKVMFTDSAFIEGFPNRYIIEYSFCEPPMRSYPTGMGTFFEGRPAPSIHFRHGLMANAIWADGHSSQETMSFTTIEAEVLQTYPIGWFGPKNNSWFDPN